MERNKIKEYILSKNFEMSDKDVELFANYFFVVSQMENIAKHVSVEKLIDDAKRVIDKVVYYDETYPIYKRLGPDCKGIMLISDRAIYLRENLDDMLKEICLYHELHHAVQTNIKTSEVGINQEYNYGRLIMEAQTQYMAEKVYQMIHGIEFNEKEIPSGTLRMSAGGTIVSALHNYEMYDSILSKLAIAIDVPKEFFIEINYLYENDEGLKLLEEKYNIAKEKYKYPYLFNMLMYMIDYIYCTDLLAYCKNPDKETILKGKETLRSYEIHEKMGDTISLSKQFSILDTLDVKFISCLADYEEKFVKFSKYLFDDKRRKIFEEALGTARS